MLPRLPALALLLAPLALPLGAQEGDLVARARLAAGADAGAEPLEGRGRALVSGASGALRVVFSPAGAFRVEQDSALPLQLGFDGQVAWLRERGVGRALELEQADEAKLVHWVLSGHWLEARELEREVRDDSACTLVLRARGTPLAFELRLDAQSLLPAELVRDSDGGQRRWTFGAYGEVAGRRRAHRWSFHDGVNEDRYEIESYRALPTGDFRPALAPPADTRFDPQQANELRVTRAPSGHLLVWPLVEGQDFGAFVLDTGAGITVIDRRVADEIGYEVLGTTLAVGVAGTTTSAYRRGERFQLGPLTLEEPIFGDLDLGFVQSGSGARIAGIVGYDLLARCVLELDLAGARAWLHDPARYALADGEWQDLVLHQNHACVRARFEGEREGLFRLDTGATGTVTFHAPAVAALDLLRGRTLRAGASGGVGGSAAAPEGELAWFELAGQRFERPRVAFSQATNGAFTDVYTTGNLGSAFLAPFRLVLDYPHDRLAFLPAEAQRLR